MTRHKFFQILGFVLTLLGSQAALSIDKLILPEMFQIRSKYAHLDPNGVVPEAALQRLIVYYDQVSSKLTNPYYASVMDFSPHSSKKRFHVIDMKSGQVFSYLAAHGKGSESSSTDDDGYANKFSNQPGSNASSLGFYRTGEVYQGANGTSLKLHGLEDTNSNAFSRAIVIHGADYVSQEAIKNTGRIGRSQGCPAFERRFTEGLIKTLRNGSLILGWFSR